MEKKNNEFDDIILEKSNKNEKIKKILLRVIALVILFLVVMIVMRLINGDEASEDNILPSEPTSVQTSENDGGEFQNMPIVQDELEDQFDLLRRQIQNDANESAGATQSTVAEENFTMPPTAALEEQSPKTEAAPKTETAQTEQPVKAAPPKTEKPKPAPKTETKASPKASDAKELFKDVNATPLHASGLPLGIYVQIFSVSNVDQKSKELAAVKAKGYTYKLYKTTVNGKEITKILIGPFAKDKIAGELAKIRQELAKDAFSFELK
ncbi:SPOR domain-containing protein [Campylobacter sp.]|uniref:SPOR domain-containing protein n=1 Tax=Campylobacter sp. TaxID=205 RepID=UPI0026DCBB74|nr:SPOR domain-containing protein [Campylobacter sp.]MDO4673632.1 SPOR domain-containing protein [Campylobacter sp.]